MGKTHSITAKIKPNAEAIRAMQAEIQQWNGRLAVCLPEAIATEIQMTAGMNVEIEIVNGKLMIHPSPKRYDLNDLLAQITPDNLHPAIDSQD